MKCLCAVCDVGTWSVGLRGEEKGYFCELDVADEGRRVIPERLGPP